MLTHDNIRLELGEVRSVSSHLAPDLSSEEIMNHPEELSSAHRELMRAITKRSQAILFGVFRPREHDHRLAGHLTTETPLGARGSREVQPWLLDTQSS